MIFYRTIASFLKDKEYRDLLLTTSFIIAIGSVVYHYLEGWEWLDCIYFSVITLTTIGYGDFSPQTDAGKIFTMFYILIGIGIILSFVNTVYNHYDTVRYDREQKNTREMGNNHGK
ncbi:MAG: potassium channel family protein [Saprospiraceae bacterium]